MAATVVSAPEASILSRVLNAGQSTISPPVAKEILQWGFSTDDRDRMSELAAKAREGSLTSDEAAEIDAFERVTSFLGLIKSKARRTLQSAASP